MRMLRCLAALGASFAIAFCWLAARPVAAADATIPPLTQGSHVLDQGGYISTAGRSRIEELATRIEAAGGGRIALYTTPRESSAPDRAGLAKLWNVDGLLMVSQGTFGDMVVGDRLKAKLTAEQLDAVDGYYQSSAPNPEAWFLSMLARIDGFVGGGHVFDGAGVLDATALAHAEASARDLGDKLGVPVYVDIAYSAEKSPSTTAFFNGADLASDFETSLIIALAVGDTKIGGFVDTIDSDIWDAYEEKSPWTGSTIEDTAFSGAGRQADVLAAVDAVQKTPAIPSDAIPWIIFTVVIVIVSIAIPFGFGGRLFYRLAGVTPPIKNGRTGDAIIESIGETGVTVSMPSVGPEAPKYKFGLQVTPDDGGPSYHVDTEALVPRIFVPTTLPGAHVGVVIDPKNPQKVNIDFAHSGHRTGWAPAGAGAGAGLDGTPAAIDGGVAAGGLSFAFDAAGRPLPGQVDSMIGAVRSGRLPTIKGSADQLLATGTHGTAVVTSCQPLGKHVRDLDPTASPDRLGDPMWVFTVEIKLPGQSEFPAVFGHRVPAARAAEIGPGTKLAVAVNEANKNQDVAIDWVRSPIPD